MLENFTVSIPAFSTDYIVLFSIFAIGSFLAFQGGGTRVAAATLAFPMALFVFQQIKDTAIIGSQLELLSEMPYITAATFVISFLVVYIALRSITNDYGALTGLALQSLMLGLALTIMTVATWYALPFTSDIWQFGEPIATLFASGFVLWWMFASFVLVYIAAQRL